MKNDDCVGQGAISPYQCDCASTGAPTGCTCTLDYHPDGCAPNYCISNSQQYPCLCTGNTQYDPETCLCSSFDSPTCTCNLYDHPQGCVCDADGVAPLTQAKCLTTKTCSGEQGNSEVITPGQCTCGTGHHPEGCNCQDGLDTNCVCSIDGTITGCTPVACNTDEDYWPCICATGADPVTCIPPPCKDKGDDFKCSCTGNDQIDPEGCICQTAAHPVGCHLIPCRGSLQSFAEDYEYCLCGYVPGGQPDNCTCTLDIHPEGCTCPVDESTSNEIIFDNDKCQQWKTYEGLPDCVSTTLTDGGCQCTWDFEPAGCTYDPTYEVGNCYYGTFEKPRPLGCTIAACDVATFEEGYAYPCKCTEQFHPQGCACDAEGASPFTEAKCQTTRYCSGGDGESITPGECTCGTKGQHHPVGCACKAVGDIPCVCSIDYNGGECTLLDCADDTATSLPCGCKTTNSPANCVCPTGAGLADVPSERCQCQGDTLDPRQGTTCPVVRDCTADSSTPICKCTAQYKPTGCICTSDYHPKQCECDAHASAGWPKATCDAAKEPCTSANNPVGCTPVCTNSQFETEENCLCPAEQSWTSQCKVGHCSGGTFAEPTPIGCGPVDCTSSSQSYACVCTLANHPSLCTCPDPSTSTSNEITFNNAKCTEWKTYNALPTCNSATLTEGGCKCTGEYEPKGCTYDPLVEVGNCVGGNFDHPTPFGCTVQDCGAQTDFACYCTSANHLAGCICKDDPLLDSNAVDFTKEVCEATLVYQGLSACGAGDAQPTNNCKCTLDFKPTGCKYDPQVELLACSGGTFARPEPLGCFPGTCAGDGTTLFPCLCDPTHIPNGCTCAEDPEEEPTSNEVTFDHATCEASLEYKGLTDCSSEEVGEGCKCTTDFEPVGCTYNPLREPKDCSNGDFEHPEPFGCIPAACTGGTTDFPCICTKTNHPYKCTCAEDPEDQPGSNAVEFDRAKCEATLVYQSLTACDSEEVGSGCKCTSSHEPAGCTYDPLREPANCNDGTFEHPEPLGCNPTTCAVATSETTGFPCICSGSDNSPTGCTCPDDLTGIPIDKCECLPTADPRATVDGICAPYCTAKGQPSASCVCDTADQDTYTPAKCAEDKVTIPATADCTNVTKDTSAVDCPCPTDKKELKADPRSGKGGLCAAGSMRAALAVVVSALIIPAFILFF